MGRFSEKVMDHFQSPRNAGRLEQPDAIGRAGTPDEPPYMVLHLRIADGRIVAAAFQTFGCGIAIACGSVLTELVMGRTFAECSRIQPNELVAALDGVPEDRAWCADLAVAALRAGLAQLEASTP